MRADRQASIRHAGICYPEHMQSHGMFAGVRRGSQKRKLKLIPCFCGMYDRVA
jgi:hypothetical protein